METITVLFYRSYGKYKNWDIVSISRWEIFEINWSIGWWFPSCIKYESFLNLKKWYDKCWLDIYSNCWIRKPN